MIEMENPITVQTVIQAPLDTVWDCWTNMEHISGWAFASDGWEAEPIENDLKPGDRFKTYMSAKDKSAGFDFSGLYTEVLSNKILASRLTTDDMYRLTLLIPQKAYR